MTEINIAANERAVLNKAALHLIPFLVLLYFVSFLDRVNVGFAALSMNADIGLSSAAFGLGAGIFFVGYFLFEVPSNLILERMGARRWIARIMITWGILSASMAFVNSQTSFLILRFLLGIAEAGFFPGVILFLTYWFPKTVRGKIIGAFLVALPLSSAIGAPLSAFLMDHPMFGLKGWQTMFVVEGLPAVALGVSVLFLLADRPSKARWLSASEKDLLEGMLTRERESGHNHIDGLKASFLSPAVWRLSLVYFGLVLGVYGLGFWAPQIIRSFGETSNQALGWLTAIPYAFAAGGMFLWGRLSDRFNRRQRDVFLPAVISALGFALCATTLNPWLGLAALVVAAVGVYSALPVFWTLPTSLLTGAAAAGGIALINSIGNLSGVVGPWVIGIIHGQTGSYAGALWLLAGGLLVAALLVISPTRVRRQD